MFSKKFFSIRKETQVVASASIMDLIKSGLLMSFQICELSHTTTLNFSLFILEKKSTKAIETTTTVNWQCHYKLLF